MLRTNVLGYPRIGRGREAKRAIEAYWRGTLRREELLAAAGRIRRESWSEQAAAGISLIPSGDFSLYDHVLDTCALVGAVPERFGWQGDQVDLDTYFAMARGSAGGGGARAMEMTKWFDTNYHYIVPELHEGQTFRLASGKPLDEYLEARALGLQTKPVLLGPFTFLLLGKGRQGGRPFDTLQLLPRLVPVYREVLQRLANAGAEWVQLDEPALVLDRTAEELRLCRAAVEELAGAAPGVKLLLTTYFEGLGANLAEVLRWPVAGLHLDLVRAPGQLQQLLEARVPENLVLSLGVVDGRNVWRAPLAELVERLAPLAARLGDRLVVGTSCSLLHVPLDLSLESRLPAELVPRLAFARQKLDELVLLARALAGDPEARDRIAAEEGAVRRMPAPGRDEGVRARAAAVDLAAAGRRSPYPVRRACQRAALPLPLFPTTTIGSFPQTEEVRRTRARFVAGEISREAYEAFLEGEIARVIRLQEELGLDVLVHGEPERNDMVQYFAERLAGFAFTQHGWVQSYGTRYVRPPLLYGDVSRPAPMTVRWATYAQSLTARPVKGMLTGPVTILRWSFVRDDQPARETCKQLALAIRDEVLDLERAGIRVIQIDEPALREGLPLRREDWPEYLAWAVGCFRLATSGVRDDTQIHTHMCYSEFNDIVEAIARLDADVLSIEASRSDMELLEAFRSFRYPNEIGPGVYDIHSPRIPSEEEIFDLLRRAARVIPPEQLWVNPDCGLKTRAYEEVVPALENMVAAARRARRELLGKGAGGL